MIITVCAISGPASNDIECAHSMHHITSIHLLKFSLSTANMHRTKTSFFPDHIWVKRPDSSFNIILEKNSVQITV